MCHKYRCIECGELFSRNEMINHWGVFLGRGSSCRYCVFERHVTNMAIANIRQTYNLLYGEYSDELLEISRLVFKIRWLIKGNSNKFFKIKKQNMITSVSNSTELRQALNENLNALLTKKRKLLLAKEVNNTLGKILSDVKMELMHNAITGNKSEISWFSTSKQLEMSSGNKLKQAQ